MGRAGARAGLFALLSLSLLTQCAPVPETPGRLTLSPVRFAELPGWEQDRQGEALAALLATCRRFAERPLDRPVGGDARAGRIADWRAPCAAAEALSSGGAAAADHSAARRYFETWFLPYAVRASRAETGLFTGYYEPLLHGARQRGGRYSVPLYARPDDLVMVDLGLFRTALAGRRIAGRVVEGRLKPYETRQEIDAGRLSGRDLELLWVDDPLDAFFLHIQGSGRVRLADGETVRVGYAGQNGQPYVAIGRLLAERGALRRDEVSLQSIRAWLAAHPAEAAEVLAANPSYVFFQLLDGDGPIGAHGVALTPGRSLAVDPSFVPLGVPVWLDATDPLDERRPLRRLMMTQDTGGAIRGAIRGDVFWGAGEEAKARAGRMRSRGRYYLLLPRAAAEARVAGRGGG